MYSWRALLIGSIGASAHRTTAALTTRVIKAPAFLPRRQLAIGSCLVAGLGCTSATHAASVASDGKWAVHEGEFTATDFERFKKAPSGLEYTVVEEGYGAKPAPGQSIKAHYAGYLLNGAKFDSSFDRRSPLAFAVGTGRVIKGWDEALLDMKIGEKRVLKIPPELGYGNRAIGPIPPGSTLVFYVELVAITT